ncbi:FAS1-like dehydratase domain-containing protein [Actinomycetospora sp. CA-101289]|uniref:FAS1-like dehydratase domain-containing protein n=1 Tax=Actinomycetospora sp. CA-101289 TaxID=3239893 RepID=UPI003D99D73C
MPLDASFVGRTWPAENYEVALEKIREFATAVGADDPVHHDRDAARAAGHPDVVAPTTFAVVFTWPATKRVVDDPALGLDFSRVIHRDQAVELHRPLHAGDVVTTVVAVDDIRELAGNDVVTFRCDVTDADGEAVLTTTATLVGRAGGDEA